MTTYIKQAQSGRSMIEMLGVLAIVGILSAGGIAGYSMAMQSYKTTALIEKVNLIATQTRNLYKGKGYATDIIKVSAQGKAEGDLINSGRIGATDAANPFGGYLAAAGATDTFTVTAENVPAESCVDLLTAEWGTTGVFSGIKVGGTAATLTTTGAISACKGGNKTIVLTFK